MTENEQSIRRIKKKKLKMKSHLWTFSDTMDQINQKCQTEARTIAFVGNKATLFVQQPKHNTLLRSIWYLPTVMQSWPLWFKHINWPMTQGRTLPYSELISSYTKSLWESHWYIQNSCITWYPRLGGMHNMLMSFIGSIDTLVANSSLEDVIQAVFGGFQRSCLRKIPT